MSDIESYLVSTFSAVASMVSPVPSVESSDASESASASSSFIAVLNPFKAPPRSEPKIRNIYITNSITTISRIISSCQMPIPPTPIINLQYQQYYL